MCFHLEETHPIVQNRKKKLQIMDSQGLQSDYQS